MSYLDKIVGISALVLGLLTMAGILSTDAYSAGARVDASGYDALNHLIVDHGNPLCLNKPSPAAQNAQTMTQ